MIECSELAETVSLAKYEFKEIVNILDAGVTGKVEIFTFQDSEFIKLKPAQINKILSNWPKKIYLSVDLSGSQIIGYEDLRVSENIILEYMSVTDPTAIEVALGGLLDLFKADEKYKIQDQLIDRLVEKNSDTKGFSASQLKKIFASANNKFKYAKTK